MKKIINLAVFIFVIAIPCQVFAYRIGIVTDIHAGNNFKRDYQKMSSHNFLYPAKYSKEFPKVLAEMKSKGVETFIALGDNTNKDTPKYAKSLIKMTANSGLDTLWVRGNHDLRKTSKYYFADFNRYYYSVDRGGWRFIVLDSNKGKPNGWGGLDPHQLEWVKETINSAPGPVIVFMHHPIFMITERMPDTIFPGYLDLERTFSESGKVKYVISGHAHVLNQYSKELNGVQYYADIPLTLKGRMGSYQIIDLPSL